MIISKIIKRRLANTSLVITLIAIIMFSVYWICGKYDQPALDQENLYWLFSSSAQSIATFVAFLLAGYTLFHSIMNDVLAKDDTLDEIILEEKKSIFSKLRILLILTCVSIVLNLSMIFANNQDLIVKRELIAFTGLSTISTVIFGIAVVIYMIDPKRNIKIAKELIRKNINYGQLGKLTTDQIFFSKYIAFEKMIKDFCERKQIELPHRSGPSPTFRETIMGLYYRKIFDKEFLDRIIKVSKYRNLLFHGEIQQASEQMVKEIDEVNEQLKIYFSDFE